MLGDLNMQPSHIKSMCLPLIYHNFPVNSTIPMCFPGNLDIDYRY